MIEIAICDDDKFVVDYIVNTLTHISKKNNLYINIHTFTSGMEFISNYNTSKSYDIIFLDILLDSLNGIDIAKHIRETNDITKIILISSSSEYILDGYDVEASNYLVKPLDYEKLYKVFIKAIKSLYNTNSKLLKINQGSKIITLPLSKVLYFEVYNRKVVAVLDSSTIEFYSRLSDIESLISNYNFVRCHRSYLVNVCKISQLSSSEIILNSLTKIPVGKKYINNVENAFFNFIDSI